MSTLVDVATNGSSDTALTAATDHTLNFGHRKPNADPGEVEDLPAIVIRKAD